MAKEKLIKVDDEIQEGDKVVCLFGDSGHKFWFTLNQVLTVRIVAKRTKTPNWLFFEEHFHEFPDKHFYANDFKKVITPEEVNSRLQND